ncbi:hypothetical protein SDJN02_05649, partial [Cucurbita argyrosperma subsp. argyrosperma]
MLFSLFSFSFLKLLLEVLFFLLTSVPPTKSITRVETKWMTPYEHAERKNVLHFISRQCCWFNHHGCCSSSNKSNNDANQEPSKLLSENQCRSSNCLKRIQTDITSSNLHFCSYFQSKKSSKFYQPQN